MQDFSMQKRGEGAPPSRDHEQPGPATPGHDTGGDEARPRRLPPDSIPDLMPGVDPQQTPGVDHPPAEWD